MDVYEQSFGRNIGILSEAEQARLATCSIAIAGMGGIGGNVAVILARMGVGRFRIADFDNFELANINRQYGATVDTIGQPKCAVTAAAIKAINPSAQVQVFSEGFTSQNGDELLSEADIAVDAIDFYSIDTHLEFHARTREHGLFTLMGSPIGFSACLQVFDPAGMSLAEYCGIRPGMDPLEEQLRYACGLVPALAHIDYYDVSTAESNTDFSAGVGPSVASACGLAAALVATEIVLILLNRRPVRAIPHTFQFDPYTFRYERTFTPGGMANYDPGPAIARIKDRSSLVPQVLDFLYGKPNSERVAVNGVRLFCRQEGSGEPLVLISPLGGDSSFWARQVDDLARSFRVVTFDGRGTGISTPCPDQCSVEDLADDLIALLEHLKIGKGHLVGLALGGLVGIEVAARRPDLVGSLVLASPYAAADQQVRDITEQWRDLAREQGMEELFESCMQWVFSAGYLSRNRAELDKLKTFFRLTTQDPDSFCQLSLAGVRYDARPVLAKVSCPVLIMRAGADRILGAGHAGELANGLPDARLVTIDEAPHFLTWECAGKFTSAVVSFLDSIERTTA